MAEVKCPSCGTVINVPEKKTGLWWGIGCLIAALALPVIVAIIGLLAAIAIPSFVKAREMAKRTACFNNMRMLETAKESAVLANNLRNGDPISEQAVRAAMGESIGQLACPGEGEYTINPVGENPECSVHGSLSGAANSPRSQQFRGH
jgi:hypothetical protein